jgi:hypothetical protein
MPLLLLRLHHIVVLVVVVVVIDWPIVRGYSLLGPKKGGRWIPNINEPFIREIRKEQSTNSHLVQLFIAGHKLVALFSVPFPWTGVFESQQARRIIKNR